MRDPIPPTVPVDRFPIAPETEDGEKVVAPVEFFPIPEDTVFVPITVLADGVDAADVTTGAAEQLVFSNTLGTFGVNLGQGNLVSDDITTTVPGNCKLRRFTFPVLGKVNPAGIGGPYIINFALYGSCPGSVPIGSIPSLTITGAKGQRSIINECQNAWDDDTDGTVNDGCPAAGPAESSANCLNATDDDGDGRVNDGCPAVGSPELDADAPRLITFIAGANAPLPTNFWFGVEFSRNNAGVVFGTPPLTGYSCDQFDYPGSPCTAWAGGFPAQPHASFNIEVYTDSICSNSFTAYKNNNPAGPTFNPGPGVTFADDIQLSTAPPPTPPPSTVCNMIAYEVAVRGDATYHFDLRRNCDGSIIAGTQRELILFEDLNPGIFRFTFSPAIPLPNNFFLSASISAASGGVVVSGQPACIGRTADSFEVALPSGCTPTVYPPPETGLPRIHAAFSAAITCAGAAPVGACCDMFQTDPQGEAVCRLVPEVNCPYPPKDQALKPEWVQGAGCTKCDDALDDDGDGFVNDGCEAVGAAESGAQCSNALDNDSDGAVNDGCPAVGPAEPGDPFLPEACGIAACCKPDGNCENLTRNECFDVPPVDSPRQWQLGRYCNRDGQRCPPPPCLGRTGECTLPRCRCPCGVDCLFPDPCSVGPECCDSCPPVGCDDVECCIIICERDAYCCNTEWDEQCAFEARQWCHFPQENDNCEGARLMTTGPPGNTAESDSGRATTDPSDPGFGCLLESPCTKGLQTVWYKFVATHTTALLQTCYSNSPANDSLLAVYAVGDPSTPTTQCNSLIPVGCSDDVVGCSSGGKNAKVCVRNLVVGKLYYILVASKIELADGTAYRLDITSPCTSPFDGLINDYCPGATTIMDGFTAYTLGGNCPNSCPETLDCPREACIPTMEADEWYNYTATCSGTLTVETCGASPETTPDTNLAVYKDCLCPPVSGPPINCSADAGGNCGLGSRVVLEAAEGSCYKIRLADSVGNRPSGQIRIECIADECAGLPPADTDSDGDVDMIDLAAFQRCYSGQAPYNHDSCCRVFDFKPDGDIDSYDWAEFVIRFDGP